MDYGLDIEIVPTCIVVPEGYRLGLWVRGKDYEYQALSMSTVRVSITPRGERVG